MDTYAVRKFFYLRSKRLSVHCPFCSRSRLKRVRHRTCSRECREMRKIEISFHRYTCLCIHDYNISWLYVHFMLYISNFFMFCFMLHVICIYIYICFSSWCICWSSLFLFFARWFDFLLTISSLFASLLCYLCLRVVNSFDIHSCPFEPVCYIRILYLMLICVLKFTM